MGATSVTGTGHGSAEGMDSGRKENTLSTSRLIGPRIVACGQVTLTANGGASGAAGLTVVLPKLPTVPDEFLATVPDSNIYSSGTFAAQTYAVVATDNTAGAAAALNANLSFPTDGAGNVYTQLVLTGTSGHVVSYAIMRQGLMP